MRVLLAEDNPMSARVGVMLIQRLGHSVDTAGDGLEVLAALEQHTYDVVLLDIHMPNLDGFGTAMEICRRWPDERPYLIALTASAFDEDRVACLAAGMDAYLGKPFTKEEFVEALSRVPLREEV